MRGDEAPAEPENGGSRRDDGAGRLGIVEFLRLGEYERAEQLLDGLRDVGLPRLRTAISWADWHAEGGEAWYDWLLPRLGRQVDLLPCVTYTPPSIGRLPKCSSPPVDLKAYADFLDLLVERYGEWFDWVELWNEPNNLNDWDWHYDHEWRLFSEMVAGAAHWMHQRGKRTVLGGMCPTDGNWLRLMCQRGVLDHIDAVGLHAFPETWQAHWAGWDAEIAPVREVLAAHGQHPAVWITEVGYSTWRHDEIRQLTYLTQALAADADRVYWYAYKDLDEDISSQEGFHFDERHYHAGIVRADGTPKLLHRIMSNEGLAGVRDVQQQLTAPRIARVREHSLITGGLGFVGANLASRLAQEGKRVLILDSLARPGSEENLRWLRKKHPAKIAVEATDVRDRYAVRAAVAAAAEIYHLAAQVAVTTSLDDPLTDFEVNARSTLNVLEAVRRCAVPPSLVVTSTNKVYGEFFGRDDLLEHDTRYEVRDPSRTVGTAESQPLDLHSPYGCSKGTADQYVLDYARTYDLPAAVFRMSCIYGPRQFGNEDQGWVAHFVRSAIEGAPLTIYGDGKQVRDVLYVGDLVEALIRCQRRIADCRGKAFNIGGGPNNSVSLIELLDIVEEFGLPRPSVAFAEWRTGDQLYYVSNTRRFSDATGWRPRVPLVPGLGKLYEWLVGRFAERLQEPSNERRIS